MEADIKADDYVVEQVKYKSKDGTEVPMFLTHKKGLKKDGANPTLLYGYGGFNISLTPTFATTRFLFLEQGRRARHRQPARRRRIRRGLASRRHARQEAEHLRRLHRGGGMAHRQQDHRPRTSWPSRAAPTAVCSSARSLTQRPDLFKAVVCQVPLLDMVRYHKFLIARLWMPEYGIADKEEDFKWIYAYSPYQKVKDGHGVPGDADYDRRVR